MSLISKNIKSMDARNKFGCYLTKTNELYLYERGKNSIYIIGEFEK